MSCRTLIQLLLARHNLSAPDGRPLYAYRLTDEEREAIQRAVQAEVLPHRAPTADEAMAYCLIASVLLARCEPGDVGSWSPVTTALAIRPSYSLYYPIIRQGLAGWRRQLLTNADHRLYLVTLACEGGLPLRVLEKEGARLTRFLRDLLLQHETLPSVEVAVLARRAITYLPKTLQNEVVVELAAKLIQAVASLRREHPRMEDREGALRADRRLDVPVDLDEQTGRLLLEGLLRAPTTVPARIGSLPALETLLDLDRDELRRVATLPRRLPVNALAEAAGCPPESLQGRVILRLEASDGSRHALAALTRSRDDSDELLLDPYATRDFTDPVLVREGGKLIIDDGERLLGSLAPRGINTLPEQLPWCFELLDDGRTARLIGIGSTNGPGVELLVLVPHQTVVTAERGVVEERATVAGRRVFSIRDGVGVWAFDDMVSRFSTGLTTSDEGLSLAGRFHELPGVDSLLWCGMPVVTGPDGKGPASGRTLVRHRGSECPWQSATSTTWGNLELRVDRDGTTVFGARVLVLPRSFALKLVGTGASAGKIELSGCHGIAAVGVGPVEGLRFDVKSDGTDYQIQLDASGPPPPTVELVLEGRTGERASLQVAFPQRREGFVSRGRALANDEDIALADLPYTRAEILLPGASATWDIDVALSTGTHRIAELPPLVAGRASFHIGQLRDVLEVALQTSSDLDHKLRLVLSKSGSFAGPRLRVRRYETTLIPLGDTQVSIMPDELERLQPSTLLSLRADAMPLFDPAQGRQPLEPVAPGTWNLPDLTSAPGPWLVLVWQGEYLRCRPLLRTLPGSPPVAADRLSSAMTEGNKQLRREKIRDVLCTLVAEPEAKEWSLVYSFLALLPEVPPSSLDVLVELVKVPEAAAFVALMFGPQAPQRVLSGLQQLPFLWEAVPLRAWISAARRLERLVQCEHRAMVAPWLCNRRHVDRPWINVLHEVLTGEIAGLGDPTEPAVSFARTAAGRAVLMGQADDLVNDLRVRAGESRWWPTDQARNLERLEPLLTDLVPELSTTWTTMPRWVTHVAKLPWLVALAAVTAGAELDASDIFAARRARLFDALWFDDTYAIALAYLVGWHKQHKKGPFND